MVLLSTQRKAETIEKLLTTLRGGLDEDKGDTIGLFAQLKRTFSSSILQIWWIGFNFCEW